MKKQKNLKEIAEIIIGYTFRYAIKEQENGEIFVIQAKNIIDNNYIQKNKLIKIAFRDYHTIAKAQKKDVLITSRGTFRAGIIENEISDTIASSSLYILRLKDNKIKSEYLMIYLNSIDGQKEIQKKMTEGGIKTILKKDLEDIIIKIPELKIQKKIIALYKNNKRQQELLSKKIDLVNNISNSAINKLIHT